MIFTQVLVMRPRLTKAHLEGDLRRRGGIGAMDMVITFSITVMGVAAFVLLSSLLGVLTLSNNVPPGAQKSIVHVHV